MHIHPAIHSTYQCAKLSLSLTELVLLSGYEIYIIVFLSLHPPFQFSMVKFLLFDMSIKTCSTTLPAPPSQKQEQISICIVSLIHRFKGEIVYILKKKYLHVIQNYLLWRIHGDFKAPIE